MGSPGSGKTTTAIKMALLLAAQKKNVVVVFCNPFVPVIPSVISAGVSHEISLGTLFTAPGLTQNQVLEACVPIKENEYISLLGYRLGETLLQYPRITTEKVVECLVLLRHLADYIILDCSAIFEADPASLAVIGHADAVLYLATANLKGVSYYQSHQPILADGKFQRNMRKMAIGNQKVGQDWETVSQLYGGADYVLPFTAELEQQDNELSLFSPLQGEESEAYQLEISKILAEMFSLKVEKIKNGKKKKKPKGAESKAGNVEKYKTRTAGNHSGIKGFRLPFRNRGEF